MVFTNGGIFSVLTSIVLAVTPVDQALAAPTDFELSKVTEFGVGEPIRDVSDVILDDGQIALEYTTGSPTLTANVGFFTGPLAGQVTAAFDQTMNPSGFSTPCAFLELGHLSAGRLFFTCASESEAGMFGTYVWAEGATTAIVNRAGGVPGCAAPLSGVGFGFDGSAVSAGRALVAASDLGNPICYSVSLGDPGGTLSIVDSGASFPAELGEPLGGVTGVEFDGVSVASLWSFGDQEYGIFVNRGQGLESWVSTGPSHPEFDHLYAAFGGKLRWSESRLAFAFSFNQEHGLAVADGNATIVVVDTNTAAPGSESLFASIDAREWTYSMTGIAFRGTPAGGLPGFYNWSEGSLSLIAKPGMILPGTSEPISWVSSLAASDDLLVFLAGHVDGSQGLYAFRAGETTLIVSTRDALDGRQPIFLDSYRDDSIDGSRVAFEVTFDDGGSAVYLATIFAKRVPTLGAFGLPLLAVVIAMAAAVSVREASIDVGSD